MVKENDDRREVGEAIAHTLEELGFSAAVGQATNIPASTDVCREFDDCFWPNAAGRPESTTMNGIYPLPLSCTG